MLLITKRRQIGCIGGHAIYAISKSEMIPIPHPTLRTNMAFSKNENRCFVDSVCKCIMLTVPSRGDLRILILEMFVPSQCSTLIRVIVLFLGSSETNDLSFGTSCF